jgi:hypothetical protein
MSAYREDVPNVGELVVDVQSWVIRRDTSPRRSDGGFDLRYNPTVNEISASDISNLVEHLESAWKDGAMRAGEAQGIFGTVHCNVAGGYRAEIVDGRLVKIALPGDRYVASQAEVLDLVARLRDVVVRAEGIQRQLYAVHRTNRRDAMRAAEAASRVAARLEATPRPTSSFAFTMNPGGPDATVV